MRYTMGRSENITPCLIAQIDVVEIFAATGQKPGVFFPRNGLSDRKFAHCVRLSLLFVRAFKRRIWLGHKAFGPLPGRVTSGNITSAKFRENSMTTNNPGQMRYSMFSVCDHYPTMPRSGNDLLEQLLQEIVLAEELGFNAYLVAEHHFHEYGLVSNPAPFLSAAALDKQFAGPAGKDMKPPVDTVAEDFEKALVPVMARF